MEKKKEMIQGNVRDKYITKKVLGSGAYGTVYLVEDKFTKEKFALKQLPKNSLSSEETEKLLKGIHFLKEIVFPKLMIAIHYLHSEGIV